MDMDMDFDQTQAVVLSDLEDDNDHTDDLVSSGDKQPDAFLRVLPQKDLPGSSYPLYEGDNTIGRHSDTCHVCISSQSLSKEHACIQIDGDTHLIFDKGSRNKTRRGKLVLRPDVRYELKHADEVSFADIKCVYEIVKQMSEVVPESDAESDVSESLHLEHDVTDQSGKLADFTGDKLDTSSQHGIKAAIHQTLVLSESGSDNENSPEEAGKCNQKVVQETVVIESTDDDSSLELTDMATQAYTRHDFGSASGKPGKSSKIIAETQKYLEDTTDDLIATQSFELGAASEKEGTASVGGKRSHNRRNHIAKSMVKQEQAASKESDESSQEAPGLFATSTLAYESNDDFVDWDDDDADGDGVRFSVVKAAAGQDHTAKSETADATVAVSTDTTVDVSTVADATVAVTTDATVDVATVAVATDATVAIAVDATVANSSVSSVAIGKLKKLANKTTSAKPAVNSISEAFTREPHESPSADKAMTASVSHHAEVSDDIPTQVFDETVPVGTSCSVEAAKDVVKKRGRCPSDVECSNGATVSFDDVSGKAIAGSVGLPLAGQNHIFDEQTQVYGCISEGATQVFGDISDDSVQENEDISEEATQAFDGVDKSNRLFQGVSNKPPQGLHDSLEKPTQLLGDCSENHTQVLSESSEGPTQVLNDSSEGLTQVLNDSSGKPTQKLDCSRAEVPDSTYDEPTQTFLLHSDDSDFEDGNTVSESGSKLCPRENLPVLDDSRVHGNPDKATEESTQTLSASDDIQSNISGRVDVESDTSEVIEDEDATQAFIDEEEEDNRCDVNKVEEPTQKYAMEAEEECEKTVDLTDFPNGRIDNSPRRPLDSSDDSDLEEMSLLKSTEGLLKESNHLSTCTGDNDSTLSTNFQPTMKYDMAVDKDPTLPYDMAIGKDPTLPYDMTVDKDPTLPYDMAVEELPRKIGSPSPKRQRRQRHNKSDSGKELDSSPDTNEVPGGAKLKTKLNSPAVSLPAKSPLKSALVDRRKSPSPSPARRHVAFVDLEQTGAESSVDEQQTSPEECAGGSRLQPPSDTDNKVHSPIKVGRGKNKKSLHQATTMKQNNSERSLDEFNNKKKSHLSSQRKGQFFSEEPSKERDVEQKSDTDVERTSTETSHLKRTRRSKVHTGAGSGSETPPLDDDVSVVSETSAVAGDSSKGNLTLQTANKRRRTRKENVDKGLTPEDVYLVNDTVPVVEDSTKECLKRQTANTRRRVREEQAGNNVDLSNNTVSLVEDNTKESHTLQTENKRRRTRKEYVDESSTPDDIDSANDTVPLAEDSANENLTLQKTNKRRKTRRQDVAEGSVQDDVDLVSESVPQMEAVTKESLALQTTNKRRKAREEQAGEGSTLEQNTSNLVQLSAKRDTSVIGTTEEALGAKESRRSSARPKHRISYLQLATGTWKKHTRRPVDWADKPELDDSEDKQTVLVNVEDSSSITSEKSVDDSHCKSNKKSVDDSDSKASNKSLDDSNSKTSNKSFDDSNSKVSKKCIAPMNDSIKPGKKTTVLMNDGNTRTNKKSETKTGSEPEDCVLLTPLNDSRTRFTRKSATSVDDSSAKVSKTSVTLVDDSNGDSNETVTSLNVIDSKSAKKSTVFVDNSNTKVSRRSVRSMDDSSTNVIKKPSTSVDDSNTKVSEQQNIIMTTRGQRVVKKVPESIDQKNSRKKLNTKPVDPGMDDQGDSADSDETASIASSMDDSSAKVDETSLKLPDDCGTEDKKRARAGMALGNLRKCRSSRKVKEGDEKECSKRSSNDVSFDVVSTASRKKYSARDSETDSKSSLQSRSADIIEVSEEKQRKQTELIIDGLGLKTSSSETFGVFPAGSEFNSSMRSLKRGKGKSGRVAVIHGSSAAVTDVASDIASSTQGGAPKCDGSHETVCSPSIRADQRVSRTRATKSLVSQQLETKEKPHVYEDERMQVEENSRSNPRVVGGRAKSRQVHETSSESSDSKPPTDEVQTPTVRGKRLTQSLVNSETSVDCSASKILKSEASSSPPSRTTKKPNGAVKRSDRRRVRKPEEAELVVSENVTGTAKDEHHSAREQARSNQISATNKGKLGQTSGKEQDKSGQMSAIKKGKPSRNSAKEVAKGSQITGEEMVEQNQCPAKEKDKSNSSSVKLMERKRRDTTTPSQECSQSGKNKDGTQDQTLATPAKKSKPMATHRTPTGKVCPEKSDSPVLRKSSVNSKPRVMFTGYLDKHGEKTVRDLGGELVTSILECTHLVTDRICRTVKFLSGLAKGLLIVSPQWLESCRQAGTFVDGHQFLVCDQAMEKQYKFNLATSISKAQSSPMLAGYKVHVTRSVKPDPIQMQDILKFAGAQYMKTMPNKPQDNTVVISCHEDQQLCLPSIKAGISVVGAEFILTGILRQELDFKSFALFQD